MHLNGQFSVKAGLAEVYEFLTDPRRVSHYLPDVTEVEIQDHDHFTVTTKVGISHLKGTMVMKMTIAGRNPPLSTTVIGKGAGLASVVDMVTGFTLETAPDGQTLVNWKGDMKIAGKLASFGAQGLLDRMAQKNVETFIDAIKNGLGEMPAAPPPLSPASS